MTRNSKAAFLELLDDPEVKEKIRRIAERRTFTPEEETQIEEAMGWLGNVKIEEEERWEHLRRGYSTLRSSEIRS